MKNDNYYKMAIEYDEFLQWNLSYDSIENFIDFLYENNYSYKIINNSEKIYKIIRNYLDEIS